MFIIDRIKRRSVGSIAVRFIGNAAVFCCISSTVGILYITLGSRIRLPGQLIRSGCLGRFTLGGIGVDLSRFLRSIACSIIGRQRDIAVGCALILADAALYALDRKSEHRLIRKLGFVETVKLVRDTLYILYMRFVGGKEIVLELLYHRPEQQKLVLRRTVPYVPDARIVPYRPEYRAQYLALHTGDRYWTGERVLAAPEIFRVLLAIEDGEAAGYIDLTHNSAVNEPYDLFVRKESRRRGLGRALLSAAVQENRPNGMALLVDIDNESAIALYESQGFDRAEGENNITAHICL